MGLIIISKSLKESNPELITQALSWLKNEYKAVCLKTWEGYNTIGMQIEGDGLPEGGKEFDICCTELVKGVIMFSVS